MTKTTRSVDAPRQKVWKPKVKTGCQTCKKRRVKCDEIKPECRRCVSNGRKCEGYRSSRYEIGSSWETHAWDQSWTPRVSVLSQARDATISSSTSILWSQPSFFVFDTTEEETCFDFFTSYSVSEFTLLFPSDWDFWGSTVLSMSMLQPAIRHSISALAALHRQYAQGNESLLPEDVNNQTLLAYGLSQYTKALKAFAELAVSRAVIDRLFATIACVLIIHISSLQGFQAACLRHLANALKLYDELQSTIGSINGSHYDQHIKTLRSILLSLQSQARSQNFDQVPMQYISLPSAPTNDDTIHFASATEVRDYYTVLSNELQHLVPDSDTAVVRSGPIQNSCLSLFSKLLAAEEGLRRLQLAGESPSSVPILTLQLDFCCLDLYLRVFPLLSSHGQMAWDIFDAHFDKIVRLSTQILEHGTHDHKASETTQPHPPQPLDTTNPPKPPRKPTFHTAQGVIGPLFAAAMHCRVPRIRHEALRLLETHPRREGLWDTVSAVCLATEVIRLEERLQRERGAGKGRKGEREGEAQGEASIARDCRVVDLLVVWPNPRVANIRLKTKEGWGAWERRAVGEVAAR